MDSLVNFLLATASGTSTATGTGTAGSTNQVPFIIMMVAMVVVMYFLMIRPQKKKQKEEQQMRDNIEVGDEITTIGGIIGRVVTVKEDCLIIETGADRNKMKITKWAVGTNNTVNEKLEAERAAAKEAQEAEKAAKMEEAKAKSKASRKKSKKNKDSDIEE